MLIKRPKGWETPEQRATPEHVFFNRRTFITAAGLATAGAVAGVVYTNSGRDKPEAIVAEKDPTADLYPAQRNPRYVAERPITSEGTASTFNNFVEFGSHKRISTAAQALPIRPWEVVFDGEVEKKFVIGIDELIRKMSLEERVYRHRCVEAWSMTVPWTGFAMKELIDLARPLSGAKYVRMETFHMPDVARGQRASWYPWPYSEALTMAEATNELAFMVTGAYGKPLAKQFGSPLRLHVPWKYGFKSVKSIVRFNFVRQRPTTFWEELQPDEYGFWANVNPMVDHARWSQASERVLGTSERIPSKIFNGYGEFVADLYKDVSGEKLFM